MKVTCVLLKCLNLKPRRSEGCFCSRSEQSVYLYYSKVAAKFFRMTFQQVWIFPLLTFIFIPGTFIMTYIIAVLDKHVIALIPYISDTGTIPPESCIFAQMINLGALFACITTYLRHRQIMEFYRYARKTHKRLTIASFIFLWIGYLGCFGMSIVANFQETSVESVHLTGAFGTFSLALIYGYGQTAFTYLMKPVCVGRWMAHLRLLICLLATPLFVLMQARSFAHETYIIRQGSIIMTTLHPVIDKRENMSKLSSDLYMVAVFSEWAYAICVEAYFLTFVAEFRKAILVPPKMVLTVDLPNEIISMPTP